MRICVCYTCVSHGPISPDYASRFVATYHAFPPGVDCDLFIIANGGPLPLELSLIFASLNAQVFPRANDEGFDLSGYMAAASGPAKDYDAVLFLGESVYFHREGWLARLVEAWTRHGAGIYGPFSSHNVRAHLNTTAFMCSPKLLLKYPQRVWTRADRYEFEHGTRAFWRRNWQVGVPVFFVTWDGEWLPRQWRMPRNILWRGTQENLLLFCNHTSRYADADPAAKARWAANADRAFQ